MKNPLMKLALLILITLTTNLAFSQSDETGCKEHPFFTRMPDFFITECSENYNEFDLVVGNAKKQTIEGTVHTNNYYIKNGIEVMPSPFQIMKNYEAAILANGGERIYLSSKYDNEGFIGGTFKMSK